MGESNSPKDEYYSLCEELYHLILKAYIDKALLEAIEMNNSVIKQSLMVMERRSFNVLGHICELIKSDLALTIWKVYFDNDGKAGTLKKLSRLLRNSFNTATDNNHFAKLSKKYSGIQLELNILRNEFLSHNDQRKSGAKIELSDLYSVLDELKEMYNSLCDTSVDKRVRKITPQDTGAISFNSVLGFTQIIQGGFAANNPCSKSAPQ